jgi:HNH endonuclease
MDLHHIRYWSNGGRTKLDNLVSLCKYHHMLVHDRGYLIAAARDGTFAVAVRSAENESGAGANRLTLDAKAVELIRLELQNLWAELLSALTIMGILDVLRSGA